MHALLCSKAFLIEGGFPSLRFFLSSTPHFLRVVVTRVLPTKITQQGAVNFLENGYGWIISQQHSSRMMVFEKLKFFSFFFVLHAICTWPGK